MVCKKGKFTVLVLILGLALPILLPLAASARGEDRLLLSGPGAGQPMSAVVSGDTLYVMTHRGLFSYDLRAEAPNPQSGRYLNTGDLSIDSLLFHGDGLMVFDVYGPGVWKYREGVFEKVADLSHTLLADASFRYESPVYQDGSLFLLAQGQNGYDHNTMLIQIKLDRETAKIMPAQGLSQLVPYVSGELLGVQVKSAPGDYRREIVTVDTQSGTVKQRLTPLENLNDGGIAYHQDSGQLYGVVEGMLSRWQEGAWEPIRPMTLALFAFYAAVHDNGYITASTDGVGVYELVMPEGQTVLSIRGMHPGLYDDAAFSRLYPNVAVSRVILPHYCAQEVYTAVQTQDDTADLFFLFLSGGLQSLMKKGYLEPLSSSGALMADHQRLYPSMAQGLSWEGELYAVAADVRAYTWMMNKDLALEIAPPQTVEELLQGREAWGEDERNEGIPWLTTAYGEQPWSREDYARYLFQQYVMEKEDGTKPVDFADPQLMALLEGIRALPEEAAEVPDASEGEVVPGVLASDCSLSVGGTYGAGVPILPPAFSQGGQPYIPAMLQVYVVNPYSKNKEMAKRYLEFVAGRRQPYEEGLLCTDIHEGVLGRWAQEPLAAWRWEYDRDTRLLETADLEAKPELEDRIQMAKAAMEDLLENEDSWLIYGPALQMYQNQLVPCLRFGLSPYLETGSVTHASVYEDLMGIVRQYLEGGLSLEGCIGKLNTLSRAVFQEGQP